LPAQGAVHFVTLRIESVMNDAIAIVLFRTLLTFIKKEFTTLSFFFAILDFLKIFFGSIGIALLVGVFSALLTKHTNFSKYPTLELILIIQYAFASYLIAEGLLLSGIVTVLFVGMFMGHYTSHNLSNKGNLISKKFFHTIAVIAETFVFTYLGLAIFSYERSKHYFDVGLIVLSIPIILLARGFNIFPLTFLINLWRTPDKKIGFNTQIMMWFAGLRGAIAFVLALMVPTVAKAEMLTTTLIIVVFTVLIFGGLTVPLLKLLNIEMHEEGETRVINNKGANRFWVFDRAVILPFLTHKQKLEIKMDEELPNDSSSII